MDYLFVANGANNPNLWSNVEVDVSAFLRHAGYARRSEKPNSAVLPDFDRERLFDEKQPSEGMYSGSEDIRRKKPGRGLFISLAPSNRRKV